MHTTTLWSWFARSAQTHGSKCAIRFVRGGRTETELTFAQLHSDAVQLAAWFGAQGIQPGERVVFYLPKSVFAVTAHMALQRLGAVAVPLNPGFKPSEMAYLLADAEPALVLCGPSQATTIADLAPQLKTCIVDTDAAYQQIDFFRKNAGRLPAAASAPSDTGLIVYTSGTTGRPKGALLTQANLVHDAANIIRIWEIAATDTLCHALPLFHVHGLCFALHTALLAGATALMLERFEADTAIEILADRAQGCTLFMAVPAMYTRLMDRIGSRRIDFGHIRLWTSGSAPLLVDVFEHITRVFGQQPVEREGMSETGMNFSNPLRGVRKPGSIGLPLPELKVRIVDPETGRDVAPGSEGELWLQGPAITPGYWRKPAETAAAFEKGWFRSGDLGRVDADGYYYLTDRIKHIIISGGENISPKEVETVINRLDGVSESSVVGISDNRWGEKVVAAVVLKPEAPLTPEMMSAHCRAHLHPWKCPKAFYVLDQLPKNTMGKVLKEAIVATLSVGGAAFDDH